MLLQSDVTVKIIQLQWPMYVLHSIQQQVQIFPSCGHIIAFTNIEAYDCVLEL